MKVLSSMIWGCLITLFVSIGAQAAEGLVLWNRLGSDEEVSNSEVGENGTVVGSSHAYEPAMHGNGYVRKAVGTNYVVFPHAVVAGLKERGSLELWINPKVPEPIPYSYGIFSFVGTTYPHFGLPRDYGHIRVHWGDTVTGRGFYGGVSLGGIEAATPPEPTQFVAVVGVPFHVAMSWDINGIDGSADTVRIYRDGVVVGSTSDSWNPNGNVEDDIILGVGPDSGGYDKFIVDNLKVWNFAKTDFSDRFNEDPTDYEFAEFSINYAMLWFLSREAGLKDWVLLLGSFVLGDDTDGIDPVTEDVTATVGSHTLTIPAGSFVIEQQGNGYRYVYRGTVDDSTVFARFSEVGLDAYRLDMWIRNMDLTDTANPMTIGLAVGDDSGEIERRLQGVLH